MTSNQETAQLLKKVAAVFRVQEGSTFRVKAYENAATAIDNSAESVYELWQQGLLDNVPGVGEGLKKYLSEFFKTGKVRHFNSQFRKVPAGMFTLMDIRGVGPITAHKIAKKFKLENEKTAIAELRKVLSEGKLTKIEGFKEKTAQKIQKALDLKTQAKTRRLLLGEALIIAQRFLEYLREYSLIENAETLGSLRRRVATVGDIDLAFSSKYPIKAMEYICAYPEISGVINKGERSCHIKLKNGYEVDLKHSYPDSWGSLLQHYTGSKMHNIKLRTMALGKGLSLSENGIKDKRSTHKFKEEKEFYDFLGMKCAVPEMREDKGEIEAALTNNLPVVVDVSDIKGDLHIHSDYNYQTSHDIGISPLSEILDYSMNNKYEYIGISDHNPKFKDLSEKEKKLIIINRTAYLKKAFRAYENRVKKCTIKLLIGMEVDIRPNGSLSLSDELINLLDYAIVSIHGSFSISREENTTRIINALSHPKAIILGHPTCRKLNEREPIGVDWDKIFDFCSTNNKIIEVNADPHRLDLPDDLIRQAIQKDVKLIINSDSHDVSQMESLKFGVWQARRGWATKKDVVNTYSYKDFLPMIKS